MPPLHEKVLSGDLPYGVRPESVTAFNIVSGDRPHRPRNPTADRWLSDSTWVIIERCWSENPQLRLSTEFLHQAFIESVLEYKGERDVVRSVVKRTFEPQRTQNVKRQSKRRNVPRAPPEKVRFGLVTPPHPLRMTYND